MSKQVAILNYGSGNLFSIQRGLRAAGCDSRIIDHSDDVLECDYLILPGVGAFGEAVKKIGSLNFFPAITEYIRLGRPFLGVCLGMQLLFSCSHEQGLYQGLGVLQGEVKKIPYFDGFRVPHVGWSPLNVVDGARQCSLLSGLGAAEYFYFTHSYVCHPKHESDILATFNYGDKSYVAAVVSDNVVGYQFHPELSAQSGIRLLKNFLSI